MLPFVSHRFPLYFLSMFAFLIKKSFFDLWDHFLPAILINLGFIALLAIPITLPEVVHGAGPVASIAVIVVGVVLLFIYLGGVFYAAGRFADYKSIEPKEFFHAMLTWSKSTVTLSLITIVHVALLLVAFPVYSAMQSIFGLFALALIFWMSVIWWITAPYYLPVRYRLATDIKAIIKKSFIIFFDNTLFSILSALGSIVFLALSFITAFLIPGVMGVAIWYQTALKLRLYKYNYLEEHPEAK